MAEIAVINNSRPSFFAANRNIVIAGAVLLFHALTIWALQTGLLMRAVEIIVPVEVLAQMVELPTPKVTPEPPKPPEPVKQVVAKPKQVTQVAPTLLAVADAPQTPNAPSVQPIAPPAPAAPYVPYVPTVVVAEVAAPSQPLPPSAPKIELPSNDAYWLKNTKPVRSKMSRTMGETGKVLIKVVIGPDGTAKSAQIHTSSGYPRLDQLALSTSLIWRYSPKKINDVPVTADYLLPFTFAEE
jgi:periplasmic protein TonB